jgi:hypothetical protein
MLIEGIDRFHELKNKTEEDELRKLNAHPGVKQ